MKISGAAFQGVKMLLSLFISTGFGTEPTGPPKWPETIQTIQIISSQDQTPQHALFYASGSLKPKPLLVALHTWSGDYLQTMSIPYAEWCLKNDWIFIHPDFRGPNKNPAATGSGLVVSDILDAVEYARQHSPVDSNRIYLVGTSGGGYTALLVVAQSAPFWAGVSVWVPITSLAKWYDHCQTVGLHYAEDIIYSCGGAPGTNVAVDQEYRLRSPLTHLNPGIPVPVDINAGIHDGHTGSVPVRHSLEGFNALADAKDQISEADIRFLVDNAAVPPALQMEISDQFYAEKKPLFRRESRFARITLFDGGHEIVYPAALDWLSRQQKNINK